MTLTLKGLRTSGGSHLRILKMRWEAYMHTVVTPAACTKGQHTSWLFILKKRHAMQMVSSQPVAISGITTSVQADV